MSPLRWSLALIMLCASSAPAQRVVLELRPRSRTRVERGMKRFNDACRAVARRHHVVLLEGFDHPATEERSTFAEDGFHPSAEGHRAAAREFLRALRSRFRARPA